MRLSGNVCSGLYAGLLACGLLGFSGCDSGTEVRQFDDTAGDNVENTTPHEEHAHGPHDGHVVELGGDDYHAEVTYDAAGRTLTVYLLQSDLKTPLGTEATTLSVRLTIDEKKEAFELTAAETGKTAEGLATEFKQTGSQLPESIKDAEGLIGEVVVTIGGKQLRGDITHDHGHDHGHDH
jgi:hypothetical protein